MTIAWGSQGIDFLQHWFKSRGSTTAFSHIKFWVDPMLFPEQNKKRFYQMYNFFSCYVLILSIHMSPQTQVNIFKYFTSKGEHLSSNEKEKGKNIFLSKTWNYGGLWGTPNYFFCMKKKEKKNKKKIFACITFEMMKVFGKLPIISFISKRQKGKKGKNLVRGKYKAVRVFWKFSYFFCSVPYNLR